jgi:hypothetical protein
LVEAARIKTKEQKEATNQKEKKKVMQKKILLTPKQKITIDNAFKNAKFTRMTNAVLSEKTLSADEKATMIFKLKRKIFGTV